MVLANLPFALVGGILAMVLLKINLSVSAAIGFIALFGTAVGNGIWMTRHVLPVRRGRSGSSVRRPPPISPMHPLTAGHASSIIRVHPEKERPCES